MLRRHKKMEMTFKLNVLSNTLTPLSDNKCAVTPKTLNMSHSLSYPWRDGLYKATNCVFDSVRVSGSTGVAMGMHWEIKTGDFGETEEEIRVRS